MAGPSASCAREPRPAARYLLAQACIASSPRAQAVSACTFLPRAFHSVRALLLGALCPAALSLSVARGGDCIAQAQGDTVA
ncbi:uncharacterized protein TRAVEDRAFT_27475 [Trametes versicolor FP-101664 SS1]|uniref:uncharacterized protein n=1 Tax=Trametes versicolor (strain FP-101664) TaxID=717944 RepID=UPI0004622E52|nr:uncharacterized protein TRAVEDRAFT_27475 [Trametes versicolor FP-101664 SS1]EIW62092.1 hypothetical protein TRAVEDRAFT_27475 [Trametes versicolor FP-101664 SS1]